jgi:hypothetical protein
MAGFGGQGETRPQRVTLPAVLMPIVAAAAPCAGGPCTIASWAEEYTMRVPSAGGDTCKLFQMGLIFSEYYIHAGLLCRSSLKCCSTNDTTVTRQADAHSVDSIYCSGDGSYGIISYRRPIRVTSNFPSSLARTRPLQVIKLQPSTSSAFCTLFAITALCS